VIWPRHHCQRKRCRRHYACCACPTNVVRARIWGLSPRNPALPRVEKCTPKKKMRAEDALHLRGRLTRHQKHTKTHTDTNTHTHRELLQMRNSDGTTPGANTAHAERYKIAVPFFPTSKILIAKLAANCTTRLQHRCTSPSGAAQSVVQPAGCIAKAQLAARLAGLRPACCQKSRRLRGAGKSLQIAAAPITQTLSTPREYTRRLRTRTPAESSRRRICRK